MKRLKVLNLYAGLGGNRKLWDNSKVKVTAVEHDPEVALLYGCYHPDDIVIIGDAHEYLLEHYKEFDLIWASPPCQSHSRIRKCGALKGQYKALFPDMKLYQEIIFLQNFAKGKWVVENVIPYYDPLIVPTVKFNRHYFWSNFDLGYFAEKDNREKHVNISGLTDVYGFDLTKEKIRNKKQLLRNCVNPKLGLHILNRAINFNENKIENLKLWE